MGGLRKYMPVTWITSLIGSLALIGTPFLSGFYSKDSIIEAVHFSDLPAAGFAYFAVMAGVFITAFYSFRMYFLVFHGEERFGKTHAHHGDHDDEEESADHHHGLAPGQKPHESPWVVTLPLILLAIPSVIIGAMDIESMLFGDFFKNVIFVGDNHEAMIRLGEIFHHHGGVTGMGTHAFVTAPFWLALAGVALSWFFYMKRPGIPAAIKAKCAPIYTLFENKYYMDHLYINVFAAAGRAIGVVCWKIGDALVIDGLIVNGSARVVAFCSGLIRRVQTGYVYHYAFAMILGAIVLLSWWLGGILPALRG